MKYDGNSLYFIMGPYIYILFQFFFFLYSVDRASCNDSW